MVGAALLFAPLALAPWAAWADEGERPAAVYSPDAAPPARAGERVRVRWTETRVQTNRALLGPETEADALHQRFALEAEWEREVTAVAGGRPTGYVLHFRRWRRQADGTEDRSLEGRALRWARDADGALRQEAAAEGEGAEAAPLSPAAQRFLDRLTVELNRPALQLLLPGRPLRAGETWTLAPEAVAARILPEAARVATGDSVARGSLRPAEAGQVAAAFVFELQLETLPGLATAIDDGGRWEAKRTCRWPAAAPLRDASWREEARFRARCRARFPDGRPYQLDVEVEQRREVTVEALPPRAE